jgi:hypothetical protein
MHDLLLRILPERLAVTIAEDMRVPIEAREVGGGIVFSDERVEAAPVAQGSRGLRPRIAERIDDPEIVPREIGFDGIEGGRIGPELLERLVQGPLEGARGVVKVEACEHEIARQNEALEGDHAAPIDAQDPHALAFIRAQRRDQLLHIVAPGGDAAEIGVTQEVIHAIGVEVGPADQFAENRILGRSLADDEREHMGGVEIERIERRPYLRQCQDGCGPALMTPSEHGLAGVAEGAVSDVV